MNFKKLLFAAVIVLSANAAIAQADSKVASHLVKISIPEIALLDLEGPADITLTGTASAEAGDPISFATTNATIWMNYSSIVKSGELRGVTVKITSTSDVPAGLKLTVAAGDYSGVGKGTNGTKTGVIILDKVTDATIVEGIGSAYTGDGVSNGHLLTYKLEYASSEIANYKDLVADTTTGITVTYTLSDGI